MSAWGSPERFRAISSAAERRAESEGLVTAIADALATSGEYMARVDLEPTQRVVDFNWAARQAGRRLGIHVDIDVTITKSSGGKASIRVAARRPPT